MNATVTQYTASPSNGASLPTEQAHQGEGGTGHSCTARSPFTCCQVMSRPHYQLSRYPEWLDTCRTDFVYMCDVLCTFFFFLVIVVALMCPVISVIPQQQFVSFVFHVCYSEMISKSFCRNAMENCCPK